MKFLLKKQLRIELLEPVVYFRHDAAGNAIANVVRGDIILNPTKPMVVKSITVRFFGIARTLWPEGVGKNKHLYDEETIYDQSIAIPLPHSDSTSSSRIEFSATRHSFPFEILLPNSIPESINADRGVVEYKLSATVEKGGRLSPVLTARQEVLLIRVPDESRLIGDSVIENSITSHRTVEGILDYTISVLTKHVIVGQAFPVYMGIQALCKGLHIDNISASILEKRVYKSEYYGTSRVENKELKLIPQDNSILNISLDDLGGLWDQEIQFKMPNYNSKLHCHTTYKLIRIHHWIKVNLVVSFASSSPVDPKRPQALERECRPYTLETPIDILSCRLVSGFNSPPRYDNPEGVIVIVPCDLHSGTQFDYETSEASPPSYKDILKQDSDDHRDSGHFE